MSNKKDTPTQNNQKQPNDVLPLVERKIEFFKDVIQKTIIHVQRNKNLDILGINEVNICVEKLGELSKKIEEISTSNAGTETIVNSLQLLNNDLSSLLKNYGTESLDDLLLVCFGNSSKITADDNEFQKFELLRKYFHPTNYKVITKKDKDENKKDCIDDKTPNFTCFDVASSYKQFHMKVYGIKVYIYSTQLKKNLLVSGITNDVIIDFLNNKFLTTKINKIRENYLAEDDTKYDIFNNFVNSLSLKDFLINDNPIDFYNKLAGSTSQINQLKNKQIAHVVKEFISDDMYNKRGILINLLIRSYNYENQYLAYLLYDLLSNDSNGNVDTQEQSVLFDSFPWSIKQSFKQAIKKTLQYTNELSNFDISKIPLEQQICLLKASDAVKEKAMIKLKEVKAKSEDSGSKARQYLDGLLKIPFGVYRREPILNMMENIRVGFKEFAKKHKTLEIEDKDYTSIEIIKHLRQLKKKDDCSYDSIKNYVSACSDKKRLSNCAKSIDNILKASGKQRIKYTHANKEELYNIIIDTLELYKDDKNILDKLAKEICVDDSCSNDNDIRTDIEKINGDMTKITNYISEIKVTLDKAVHGHDKAKKQIERIIGQWINGQQDGYCFGFEGAPGIGKTSLAKRGLSDCLKDENGIPRPFAMIQMGGDSNGSTLHGHNYTYVGSTWGSIVQILIDKKCMNPIIFIDEVDKISRTEHGKEIVGILTHLLDPAQNDCFQDKYFNGIDLDLSKALFILSYNDAEAIDKILLDRVHRIKFSNPSLEDKITICNVHILPEVYKKMGLEGMIHFSDEVLKFIIDEYTAEAGVRKLKEILFEIVGEINLDVLKNDGTEFELPINMSVETVRTKYFKDKHEIRHKKIHTESHVGIINGLWANAMGKGGVIPIQVSWRPSERFLSLHLTGMQGDVMKESMNVALTLAWDLTGADAKKLIREEHTQEKHVNGVHIHCPEGATPKDGPSAGTAITTAIYSLLNNKKIKYSIAITGEICLNGNVTEIGGLDLKILGAIKAGVKEILFPTENMKDYNTFMDKYKETPLLEGIKFHPVSRIEEVFKLVFEE